MGESSHTFMPRVKVKRIDTQDSLTGGENTGDGDRGIVSKAKGKVEEARERLEDIAVYPEGDIDSNVIERVLGKEDKLAYTLEVSGPSEMASVARARAYVRAKNPFEPSSIDIINVSGDGDPFIITVGVTK